MNKKLKEFLIQHDFVISDNDWFKKQLKDSELYLLVSIDAYTQNIVFRIQTSSGFWYVMRTISNIKQIGKLKLLFDFKQTEHILSRNDSEKLKKDISFSFIGDSGFPEIRYDGIKIVFWKPYKDTLLRILKGKYAN